MKRTPRILSFTFILLLLFAVACQPEQALEDVVKEVAETVGEVAVEVGENADEIAEAVEETAAEVIEVAEETMSDSEFDGMVRIGAAISDSGKYAREGEDVRQGYTLWAEWVNEEYGGIKVGDKRYGVEIIYYDDESNPDTGANLTEKLITEDEVDFLLGPYSSSMTASASAIAEKYGMIMVEGNGSSESLFERGFQNLFAVLTPAGNYTQSALEILAAQGAKTVVIAYEDTAFPTSVGEGAVKWAAEYGLEVLAVETYPKDVADVSAIMTKFRDLDPDIFVGGGHYNDALLFVAAAEELNFNPDAMVITVGPSNPEFVTEVGGSAEYIVGPTQWERTMSWNGPYFGTSGAYGDKYEARWGESPTYQAAESTAAGLTIMAAIEAAGTLDMDAVRQELRDLDIETFYGPINFDETGKNVGKPMGAVQIQDGQVNVIAPAVAAVAPLAYPMAPFSDADRNAGMGTMEDSAVESEEVMAEACDSGNVIRLGAAVSESGKYAREGEDVSQGYTIWADYVNNHYGGIKVQGDCYNVEIVYYDDESDPDTGANLTEKLITEDEVDFLLGPYSSSMTAAASAIAEKYGVIMVEGNGSSESLFERGFQNLFAVLTPAGNYTQSALEILAAQGAKTVVIAYEDTAFPTSVGEGAVKWATEYGLEVLAVETYPKDVADVSAIMTKFRDLDPDVFVGGGHYNDALLFVAAAEELGFNPQGMVITVGPSNPQFVEEVGARANGIMGPTQWESTMSWESPYFGSPANYAEQYTAMFGETPTYQAAESTAVGLALMAAIENADSLDMDAVRTALQDLDIETFYGPINFDETGKNVGKPMGTVQVQDGVINVVAPSAAAVAPVDYPLLPWADR
ncbi:MAG: branched-chain amino acid transport system substrate-binding protein [Cellvibrionaceae bacterium]|jgi:branched-chain amino acid transport system substrate-binding protein